MIGVEGRYIFGFSIGKQKDFIVETELQQFTLIERAGNLLPEFRLMFNLIDESLMYYLHEGNQLRVSFGKTIDSMTEAVLSITKNTSRRAGSSRQVELEGAFDAFSYVSNPGLATFPDMSGIECIKAATKGIFHWEKSNVSKSDDSMTWIRYNTSLKKFVNEVWMHSYFKNSIPLIGISSDGTFICKSMKELLTPTLPDWRFVSKPVDMKRDISYDPDVIFNSDSVLSNVWTGYGRKKLVYNQEDGSQEFISERPEPMMAITKDLARKADMEERFASIGIQNDNIHENYNRAAMKNLGRLVSLGVVSQTLTFRGQYIPVKVLDRIEYMDDNIENNSMSSEFNSGVYIVSKVARTLSQRTFVTSVTICRESMNQLQVEID